MGFSYEAKCHAQKAVRQATPLIPLEIFYLHAPCGRPFFIGEPFFLEGHRAEIPQRLVVTFHAVPAWELIMYSLQAEPLFRLSGVAVGIAVTRNPQPQTPAEFQFRSPQASDSGSA